MLVAALLMIPLYVVLSKLLILAEGLTAIKGEFVGKGILTIIALLIWFSLARLADVVVFAREGDSYLPREPWAWGLVGFILPIVIACAFYKISARLMKINGAEPSTSLDNSVEQ